jgi:hypothetical protein
MMDENHFFCKEKAAHMTSSMQSPGLFQTSFLFIILMVFLCTGCSNSSSPTGESDSSTSSSSSGTGAYTQSGGTTTLTGKSFTATGTDESGVLVTSSGTLTLTYSTVATSGNTTSTDSSSFYGLNAGVLANSASTINLSNCRITTTGSGANGVFSTGSGSSVVLTNDTITCTATASHGVDATVAGSLTMTGVIITTAGDGASAAISTDRGGGTIVGTNVTATTSGTNSPAIYSTGSISISNSTLKATGSEAAVIEGLNTVALTSTSLSGGVATYGGAMIYQSMSGDASVGTGSFTMTGGSFTATAGPLFFITNTRAVVSLTGTSISTTSGTFIDIAATSRWGATGSNGGTLSFTASGETLTGAIKVDSLSTISANLKNSTTLTGAVNAANSAKADTMILDGTSKWTAAGNSYVTRLTTTDSDSSTVRSYVDAASSISIYYKSSANSWLGGKTYTLTSGGSLTPQ